MHGLRAMGRRRFGGRAVELFQKQRGPLARPHVPAHPLRRRAGRDEIGALGFEIEGQDHVVKPDTRIGHAHIVDPGAGDAFEKSPELIAEIAGRPALERRNSRYRFRGVTLEILAEDIEEIARHSLAVPIGRAVLDDQRLEGIGGEKRIAADLGIGPGAVEEHQPVLAPERTKDIRRLAPGNLDDEWGVSHQTASPRGSCKGRRFRPSKYGEDRGR